MHARPGRLRPRRARGPLAPSLLPYSTRSLRVKSCVVVHGMRSPPQVSKAFTYLFWIWAFAYTVNEGAEACSGTSGHMGGTTIRRCR